MSFSLKLLIECPHVMSPCTGHSHARDLKAAKPGCALCSATYALRSYLYLLVHTLIAAPAALWLGAGSGYSSDYLGLVAVYASAASCAWPQEVLLSVP